MTTPLRLFLTIETNATWQQHLATLIEEFRKEHWGQQVNWIAPENLHLTLRFIGACTPARVPLLKQHVTKAIKGMTPFSLKTGAIHLFPSTTNPRLVALETLLNPDLFDLQQAIEHAVTAAGFAPEKHGFLPHFTLGRIPPNIKISLPKDISSDFNTLSVNDVALMNSVHKNEKRIYTPLHRFALTGQVQIRVGVGAIVMKDNKVLLVKRKNPPNQGLWAIPGGKVELGETLQQTAEREILEETGITIRAKEPIYIFDFIEHDENQILRFHYVIVDLNADYLSGEIAISDESEDVRWVSQDEFKQLECTKGTRKVLEEKVFLSLHR